MKENVSCGGADQSTDVSLGDISARYFNERFFGGSTGTWTVPGLQKGKLGKPSSAEDAWVAREDARLVQQLGEQYRERAARLALQQGEKAA